MMKVLIVLYSKLIEDAQLVEKMEEKVRLLKKLVGPDSLYAVITSNMKHLFDKFPELVFLRNDEETLLYGIYKGLRKLRGNDVLLLDGKETITKERIINFISQRRKNLLSVAQNGWRGVAVLKMIDLDYIIRTMERFLKEDTDFLQIMKLVKEDYGIEYEVL
ncbi:hypothetical protein [Hydrogenobacter thermophilus]|uniref:hypothetical protein n=1 Tax=Hydrogenobacter thermophilus TaxID=940 RepID=UPI0026F19C9E|nr:hypothetical protein [Hydrogenobacter thermophilus]